MLKGVIIKNSHQNLYIGVLFYCKAMKQLFIFFLLVVLLLSAAEAAVVTGKLYDSRFEILKNTVVEINTFPKQTYVSKDGTYTFTLTSGRFTLTAFHKLNNGTILYASKQVLMPSAGTYKVDLILDKPYTGEELPSELNRNFLNRIPMALFLSLTGSLLFVISILVFFLFRKKNTKTLTYEDNDIQDFIKAIRDEGGRTTQKELRKKFQKYSEAKVSLIVSEMESKGIIEKIKKGRGNIIILK